MKTYVALDGNGRSIVTVIARDEQEAGESAREHPSASLRAGLDRPGRRAHLSRWLEGGAVVKEKGGAPEPDIRGG
jgi:hypothetical protein